MNILAIDPGNIESAFLLLDADMQPIDFGKVSNETLLESLRSQQPTDNELLSIETMKPRGMPMAFEEMQTQLWAGRFIEAWGGEWIQAFRQEVKVHICGRSAGRDSNIRQALIDLYGGKDQAVGKKKNPGPLYGISKDVWSALAIAVTTANKRSGLTMASLA